MHNKTVRQNSCYFCCKQLNTLTATKNNNYNGALQQPLQSVFSATSSAMEAINGIDLQGKTTIVTGGYAGIGLETVKAISKANVAIWVPARDTKKATQNLSGISNVRIIDMDLMDPASIERFATNFISSGNPLHLLINPART